MPRTVIRAADLKPPSQISDEDFDEICKTSAIPASQRAVVRDFLDEAVAAFAEAITADAKLPTRKADRRAIQQITKDIRRAQRWSKRAPGPAGRMGLRRAGRKLGFIVSASWMRTRFPHDEAAPAPVYWPLSDRDMTRSPSRVPSRPVDIDELSLDARTGFMEQRALVAIATLLGDIADALESGRRAIVQLPDRKGLVIRDYLLAALAELWRRLGRRPTSGPNSKFGVFAEAVFEAIGWPTSGVNAALADAIVLRRRLYSSATPS
jgi:histone H3/H4